jgi:hypothetical protein
MDRRIVWALVISSGAALYAGCSPCSTKRAADAIAPVTITDGGLGDPCEATSQCSAGLDCRDVFPSDSDFSVERDTFRACTRDCTASACPTGFVCADLPTTVQDGGQPRYCLPGCSADADCLTGHRAGKCVGEDGGTLGDGGTSADGGAVTGQCRPIVCGPTTTTECPSSFNCQAGLTGGGSCSTGTAGAAEPAPPPSSWCGK